MNTHENTFIPKIQFIKEAIFLSEEKNETESIDYSFSKQKFSLVLNEISSFSNQSHRKFTGSCIESSELGIIKKPFKLGDRVSTVILTSESVLSRNRLQECSVYLEKLCEYKNTLIRSRKFEEQVKIEELPELYMPVFTGRPTIAFCNHCGRDVKTKVQKINPKFFGFRLSDIFCCCIPKFNQVQVIHRCSRCRNQIIKINI